MIFDDNFPSCIQMRRTERVPISTKSIVSNSLESSLGERPVCNQNASLLKQRYLLIYR